MKTTLTIEQSAKFIELGVSPERASERESSVAYGNGARGIMKAPETPIFTLTDILEILPKHIPFANAEWYLNIQCDILDNKWHVQYLDFDHYDEEVKEEEALELIDALYMLTLAVINHVKLD